MQSRQPYFHDVPAWHWLDSGIGWTITKISSHHCDILKSLSSNDAPPHPFESTYESHTLTRNSSSMLPKYHKPIRWFNRTNYYPIMIQPKEQSENISSPNSMGFPPFSSHVQPRNRALAYSWGGDRLNTWPTLEQKHLDGSQDSNIGWIHDTYRILIDGSFMIPSRSVMDIHLSHSNHPDGHHRSLESICYLK